MDKPTTTLSPQDRVILFCVATGIVHGSVGITDNAMQSMAIRGFVAHNRESGVYTLTDSGRATLTAILDDARLGLHPNNNRDAGGGVTGGQGHLLHCMTTVSGHQRRFAPMLNFRRCSRWSGHSVGRRESQLRH
jgi:hypothetical protein